MLEFTCVCICINSYCLLGDCVYVKILKASFVEMYVNMVFVKLFVQRSEFNVLENGAL